MDRMKKLFFVGLSVTVITLLSACMEEQGAIDTKAEKSDPEVTDTAEHYNLNNPSVIPSETSDKKNTTNKQGTTYSGMGKDLYSSIGSSGIHAGGISSYFESILEGVGITGVKVFVVDDSVILARKKKTNTSHKYDNMQQKLLNGSEGMSGKGEPQGINNSNSNELDNMVQAKKEINDMFNGNVKILTATDPQALEIIKSIEKNIKSTSYEAASNDLLQLLKMTKE
ncbi:hypothetical protein GCM10009001_34210 [Virgibacillus siamensis]|uniref:Sporulation lipoprotein YhcN/YlaJ (Spore_YhcN_YlaJ) n=1 Tax=Virgibacillus siamensis TaxID=480071 RepID=A0ABP3RTP1_9BACI